MSFQITAAAEASNSTRPGAAEIPSVAVPRIEQTEATGAADGSTDITAGQPQPPDTLPTPQELREALEIVKKHTQALVASQKDLDFGGTEYAASEDGKEGPEGPSKIKQGVLTKKFYSEWELEEWLTQVEGELMTVFEEAKLENQIIAALAEYGFTEIGVFAKTPRSEDDLRNILQKEIGLEPSVSSLHRTQTARALLAWEAACERKDATKKMEAEARAGGMPKSISKVTHTGLRKAYETAHRRLETCEEPSIAYLEMRLEQFEDSELVAERLDEITSKKDLAGKRDQGGEAWSGAAILADGKLRVRRSAPKSTMPHKPEQLRSKYKLMARAWETLRLRTPKKPIFRGLTEQIWDDHVDWLLGPKVYDTEVRDPAGNAISRPTWGTLMEYELELRRRLYEIVNEGDCSIADALHMVRSDQPLFSRFFITPTSLQAGVAAALQAVAQQGQGRGVKRIHEDRYTQRPHDGYAADWNFPTDKGGKGKGKGGKDKGKGGKGGKDNGKGGKNAGAGAGKGADQAAAFDPNFRGWRSGGSNWSYKEGKWKCFKSQKETCQNPSCQLAHRCLVCDGQHGEKKCPMKPQAQQGDAAGRLN